MAVLERDGYQCRIKGPKCRGAAAEVDHIVPWRDGGAWFDPANLRAACSWCNTWRANRQKTQHGWQRSTTRIVLVAGPPGACEEMRRYIAERAAPQDVVIDYGLLAAAVGGGHEQVRRVRASLLAQVRRGEVNAPRVWVTSTNPKAAELFAHHELVVVDPGREYAAEHMPGGEHLVDEWYGAVPRQTVGALREW